MTAVGEAALQAGQDEDRILCHNYTRARRHPKVVGTVQGHKLPFGLILWTVQLAVFVGSFMAVMWTRGLWGQVVTAGPAQLVVVLAIPVALTCAVRYARMEGRAPMHMLSGVATYLGRRSKGVVVAGRAVREGRRRGVIGCRLYVESAGR
jgi:hypothetical protein